MSKNASDIARNQCMLTGKLARRGYDWWWHSFTARDSQTGAEKSFFIEFYLCNPALASDKPTFGLDADGNRGNTKPSYLMVKAGTWGADARQLHRFFAWKDVDLKWGAPFCISAGDCTCCETDLFGSVKVTAEEAAAHPEWMSDAGEMKWDLKLNKEIPFNVGFGASAPMRNAQAFEMYWHAEGMKTTISGTVVLDGRLYYVEPELSYGYCDKNWGADFTSPWVWLSSWNLSSRLTGELLRNSVFDIGGGRPVVLGQAMEGKLLSKVYYEGREFEFNFSKVWTGCKTEFDCGEEEDRITWHVEQESSDGKMIVDIWCPKDEMLLVNYESPDGMKRHDRLWNGGTGRGRIQLFERKGDGFVLVDDMNAANIGCEYGEYTH